MDDLRRSSLVAGAALLTMAVAAPLGLLVALPAGHHGVAALTVLLVVVLDVVVAVALLPVLTLGGTTLARTATALRLTYAAAFLVAGTHLVAPVDEARFEAGWGVALAVFGAHLVVVGAAAWRSGVVPRWIGALVGVGGLGYLVDAAGVALDADWPEVGAFTFLGEIALLIWLLAFGAGRAARPRSPQTVAMAD